MKTARTRRFAEFLEGGGGKLLTPREERVATMLVGGKSLDEIADSFAVTAGRIRSISDKTNRKIIGFKKVTEEQAEFERFVEASKTRSLSEIPIEKLFDVVTYSALRTAGVETLLDIVSKGRSALLQSDHIGEGRIGKIEAMLKTFGLEWPEDEDAGMRQMYEQKGLSTEARIRDTFSPFFIATDYGSAGSRHRFDGASTMRQMTLEEVEQEFGRVEAQMWQAVVMVEREKSDGVTLQLVENLTIWTDRSVITIGNYDGKESLRDVPRNPSDYK